MGPLRPLLKIKTKKNWTSAAVKKQGVSIFSRQGFVNYT